MSWLFSQALVAEYSDRISWDVQQCAQLNVMPTPHKFWRNDKMMEFSRLSLFGLTLQLLTEDHGEELLTLFLADFHARTSHLPEKAQGLMENVQDFGQKWHELSVKFDLEKSGWKTHQCLFPEDLPESSVTLPKWGMTRTGHVFQHLTLGRPISATDSGLWATPQARDFRNGQSKRWDNPNRSRNLNDQIAKYPTPKASDGNKRGNVSNHPRNGLAGVVENLPTPTASMSKGSSPATLTRKDGKSRVNDRLDHHVMNSHGGKLNPDWVEWLMGWPIGWTDLKPLEIDKFQSWLKAHSYF
ncbi:putative cytosine-specific methyltransferase [Acinetobacter baumannii 1437282]|nr:putative cytosine-specific methyltransferase [Acinetobacter baumannii 1437282]